jgi:hypothetical protein
LQSCRVNATIAADAQKRTPESYQLRAFTAQAAPSCGATRTPFYE